MKGLSESMGIVQEMPTLIVRYGEVGLKSERVRRRFESALLEDIRKKHVRAKVQCVVSSDRGRIYVDSSDWHRSCELLSRTFGIVSFSPATKVGSDLDGLADEIVRFAGPLLFPGASFAIRARRSGSHPYTSQDVCVKAGAAVLSANEERGIKVDLDDPDVEISVEVRGREAYLFSSTIPGPGGLPRSTQGRVLALLESNKDVAAAWLLMKRGCTVVAVCDDENISDRLLAWDAEAKVIGHGGDAFAKAASERCLAVSVGWDLKDLREGGAIKGAAPVFYPLVGLDDDQIAVLVDRVARA